MARVNDSVMSVVDGISGIREGMEHLHSIIAANPEISIECLATYSGLLVEKFEQIDLSVLTSSRELSS